MSQHDVTPREALTRLGASTAEAIAQVLEMFIPGVERGEVSVLADGADPFANLPFGAVATSVSYIDGVTGANIFVLTQEGARALAGAMGVPPPEPGADTDDGADTDAEVGSDPAAPPELSELEVSAIAEAANQMMAAAAAAISVVLGQEVEISPPETRIVDHPQTAGELYGTAPHATSTTFLVAGEACRLIQLVPSAFVVRMARAIDELSVEQSIPHEGQSRHGDDREVVDGPVAIGEALTEVNLRVWAELGRARLPLGQTLELPLGSVVDLDRTAGAPVELFVNGLRFAHGHLLVTDDGEWAICLEALGPAPEPLTIY